MIRINQPLTRQTTEDIYGKWIGIINRRECGSIINITKRAQLYRIKYFFENIEIIKKYLKHSRLTDFTVLDLGSIPVEDAEDLKSYLALNKKTKKYQVFFIVDADTLIDERLSLISFLNSFYQNNTNYSIVYFFKKNIKTLTINKKLVLFNTLFQNVIPFTLFGVDDMKQFMFYLENHYQTKIPEWLKKKILFYCGGEMWLVKQAVRHYVTNHDIKTLFVHEAMRFRLKTINNEFSAEEKSILKKIIKKDYSFNQEEIIILQYLQDIKLIKKNRLSYCFTVPLLEEFMKEELNKQTLITINEQGQIIINNLIADNFFSRRERLIIKNLVNKRQTISRENIAEIIWGKDYAEKYTDWALDQIFRRLKNKFIRLGLRRDLIKAKKNQGYYYNSSSIHG